MAKAGAALKRAKNQKWEDLMAFHLQVHGLGKKFAREVKHIPGRQFRLDFGDPVNKVGIEVQGGVFMAKGAHNTGPAITRDCVKNNLAHIHGWRVFQFTPKQIQSLEAVELIASYYRQRLGIEARKGE